VAGVTGEAMNDRRERATGGHRAIAGRIAAKSAEPYREASNRALRGDIELHWLIMTMSENDELESF
jgi:hypothetical protein